MKQTASAYLISVLIIYLVQLLFSLILLLLYPYFNLTSYCMYIGLLIQSIGLWFFLRKMNQSRFIHGIIFSLILTLISFSITHQFSMIQIIILIALTFLIHFIKR